MKVFSLTSLILVASQTLSQWLPDTAAYMIGDYVEIGINNDGHEGARTLPSSHGRSTYWGITYYFGMVADPDETGWTEYDGDFFTPGSPENGFGLEFGGVKYAVNAVDEAGTYVFPGEITDYYESTDSIIVTWVGDTSGVELTVKYSLKRDEHFYTTDVSFANTSASPISDIYYYKNIDPDNNVAAMGTYVTNNVITKQSATDPLEISTVIAFSNSPASNPSRVILQAQGANWKAYKGGFANRDAADLWNGVSVDVDQTVGDTVVEDKSIGLAYKIATLPTGKAEPTTISFVTSFKTGAGNSLDVNHNVAVSPLNVYSNWETESVRIELEGSFEYYISNTNGQIVARGNGVDAENVDLSNLSPGMYFVRVRKDKVFYTEKIVK